MLRVDQLHSSYGRIEVLHGIDLQVGAGEIVVVVGANGAGKTTLLRCVSGIQPAASGKITFRGDEISRLSAWRRVRLGLTHAPEGRQIFTNLTVEENLRLGAFAFADKRVDDDMEDAFTMFPILREKRNLSAGGLSGGQQQMLAIARALMGRPACLLLDEPSMGLAPKLVSQIFALIAALRERDVAVLLVEQNAHAALGIADRGYVMETGRITLEGGAEDLRQNPGVRAAYLGA